QKNENSSPLWETYHAFWQHGENFQHRRCKRATANRNKRKDEGGRMKDEANNPYSSFIPYLASSILPPSSFNKKGPQTEAPLRAASSGGRRWLVNLGLRFQRALPKRPVAYQMPLEPFFIS